VGRIVVSEFVSVDGVMEAPGGEPGYPHTGWVGRTPDGGQFEYKFEEVRDAEAQLLGRVTYESFAGAWPHRDGPFADRMNTMPKHVVSSTLHAPEWNNSHLLTGDPMAAARELRDRTDGDLLVAGSRTLVHALMRADLVDELRLMVVPLIWGGGLRIFPDGIPRTEWDLASSANLPGGTLGLQYLRRR
jgi:dihydrofolate reductase